MAAGMIGHTSYVSVILKLPVIFVVAFGLLQSLVTEGNVYDSALAAPTVAACLVYFVINLRPFLNNL